MAEKYNKSIEDSDMLLRPVSDDTMNCLYFSSKSDIQNEHWDILCREINQTIAELSSDYLWHKEKLQVFPPILNKKADDVPVHLFSSTCFGDNIEDEWFSVYIIYELTKIYDIIVHMTDNDGEFILIEAADFLPKWMNPENTDKRQSEKIFLFIQWFDSMVSKKYKLLYLKSTVEIYIKILSVTAYFTAIAYQEQFDLLEAFLKSQRCRFSSAMVFVYKGEIHIIPESLVKLDTELSFKDSISLIQKHAHQTKAAGEIQQAILKRVSDYPEKIKDNIYKAVVELPPEIATVLTMQPDLISPIVNAYCNHDVIDAKCCRNLNMDDTIYVKVNLTKCQYAQLMHSRLMKTASKVFTKQNDKKFILGLKLACGYKIIMNESSNIFNSKEHRKFLENLTKNGYFQGNIEGSKVYMSLLEKANEYFSLFLTPVNTTICKSIKSLMCTENFQKKMEILINSNQESLQEEENDDWLNINPGQLNTLLTSRYGRETNFDQEITPQTISNQLTKFLHQTSDFEGIELDKKDADDNNEIEFDCELFSDALHNMLNLISDKSKDYDDDDFISENEDENETEELQTNLDHEILESLSSDLIGQSASESRKSVFQNIVQSLKEEEGSFGPSSNILKNIGIHKTDLLDSDDDSE